MQIRRVFYGTLIAAPMTFGAMTFGMGGADARPWIQEINAATERWNLPFLIQGRKAPRRPPVSRAERERQQELARELNRMPQSRPAAAAGVFPTPPAPPVRDARAPAEEAAPPRVAAVEKDPAVERELRRELARLPAPSAGRAPAAAPVVPASLACAERLAKVAKYAPLPDRAGPGQCGATDLVRLEAILMADSTSVALNPAPQIRCEMAEEVAAWIRDDVGPAAASELGSPLASITDNDSYDCRPRNNVKGAKMSEHGRANALDLTALRLKNGGVFTLTDKLVSRAFRNRMRDSACARFMTVLGPGADPYHAEHVHLDLAERSHKTRICQWNVHEQAVADRSPPPAAEPEPRKPAAASPGVVLPTRLPLRKPEALAAQARAGKPDIARERDRHRRTHEGRWMPRELYRGPVPQRNTAPGYVPAPRYDDDD